MKRAKALVCMLVGLCMLLAACGQSTSTAAPDAPASGSTADASGGDTVVREPYTIRIGSGPSGAIHYVTFNGIANLIEQAYPEYKVQVEISTGSNENVRGLYDGLIDFGLVTADSAKNAYNATGDFEGEESGQVAHVMSGYAPHLHYIVLEDSNIHTAEDLRGKRAGTGKGFMASHLPIYLEAYGMTIDDMASSTQLSLQDICNGLADGTIDVGVYITDFPSAPISDLAVTKGIRLLEIDDEAAAKIIETNDHFYPSVIQAGSYPGLDVDVKTLATRTCLIASPDVPEQVVYDVVKVICESQDKLGDIHPRAPMFNTENALDGQMAPLHPGAERYYKEIGLLP